jgi:hypothetical protein
MRSIFEKKNKGGMIEALTGLAYGVVAMILIVAIGLVVLSKFGGTLTAGSAELNATNYGITQLSSTGLLGWLPAVIALAVGLLFLVAFMGKNRAY